ALFEGAGEAPSGFGLAREEQAARGVAVEPVHRERPALEAEAQRIKVVLEAEAAVARRIDRQACRLVDYDRLAVEEKDAVRKEHRRAIGGPPGSRKRKRGFAASGVGMGAALDRGPSLAERASAGGTGEGSCGSGEAAVLKSAKAVDVHCEQAIGRAGVKPPGLERGAPRAHRNKQGQDMVHRGMIVLPVRCALDRVKNVVDGAR